MLTETVKPKSAGPQFSRNLDILRAIAVLSVLGFHMTGSQAPHLWAIGRFGVLIFFVHTCLVLMQSLERTSAARRSGDFDIGLVSEFYIRRAFRIYPLSVLCLLIALAFQIPPSPDGHFIFPTMRKLVSNLLLTQDWTMDSSILDPMWSLPLEVRMYMALPLLFLVVQRTRVGLSFFLWAAASLAALIQPSVSARMDIAQYVPCFLGGVIAYQLRGRLPRVLPSWAWPLVIAGLGALYAAGDFGGRHYRMRGGWVVCLALGVLLPFFRESPAGLLSEGAKRIATYSYGIYMTHVPLLYVWYYLWPLRIPPLAHAAVYLASVLVASMLAYHLFELPMIRVGARVAERVAGRGEKLRPQAAGGVSAGA